MFRELETLPDSAPADGTESPVPCYCQCSEPTRSPGDEAPAGNKTAVVIEVDYDLNGQDPGLRG